MSSALLSADAAEASSIRPRHRRLVSVEGDPPSRESSTIRGTARLASGSSTPRRDRSPVPSARLHVAPPETASRSPSSRGKSPAGGFGAGLLDGSWTASWNSVQDLASGWLSGGAESGPTRRQQYSRADGRNRDGSGGRRSASSRPWAQERTASSRPTIEDVGAGVMAEREAALTAARVASVLESRGGVNGGLDVAGKFKARTSDDVSRQSGDAEAEDVLAYIHHVQPDDTYAGIILKYGCGEDRFRKVNGLWSRDSVSMRKWVALPVDACEVKGRPCAGPSDASETVDLLAPTPECEEDDYGWRGTTTTSQQNAEDIFGPSHTNANGSASEPPPEEETKPEDPTQPWTHVRWVSLDSLKEPVEIGRISRRNFGYFRPRRKKGHHLSTMSPLSTPRPSIDVQSTTQASSGDGADDRGGGAASSRRQSVLSNRPVLTGGGPAGKSTPASTRSGMGSGAGADPRPLWMRQPGGVGSMGLSARAPGPGKDKLNSWAKKHFPALTVEGTETGQFGFSPEGGGPLAEIPPGDAATDLSIGVGTGIDRAAAAVETWLRGALAKRPGTPTRGGEWGMFEDGADLIELTDTRSDDGGRPVRRADSGLGLGGLPGLIASATGGASGRAEASAPRRGRNKDKDD